MGYGLAPKKHQRISNPIFQQHMQPDKQPLCIPLVSYSCRRRQDLTPSLPTAALDSIGDCLSS